MAAVKQNDVVLVDGNGLYAKCIVRLVPTEGLRALCNHICVSFVDPDNGAQPHPHDLRQFWVESKNCSFVHN